MYGEDGEVSLCDTIGDGRSGESALTGGVSDSLGSEAPLSVASGNSALRFLRTGPRFVATRYDLGLSVGRITVPSQSRSRTQTASSGSKGGESSSCTVALIVVPSLFGTVVHLFLLQPSDGSRLGRGRRDPW